jgi:hypothetical protein
LPVRDPVDVPVTLLSNPVELESVSVWFCFVDTTYSSYPIEIAMVILEDRKMSFYETSLRPVDSFHFVQDRDVRVIQVCVNMTYQRFFGHEDKK